MFLACEVEILLSGNLIGFQNKLLAPYSSHKQSTVLVEIFVIAQLFLNFFIIFILKGKLYYYLRIYTYKH